MLTQKRKRSLYLLPEIKIRDMKESSTRWNVLTVDLKVIEHAHPPENHATESDWVAVQRSLIILKARNVLAMVREKPTSEGREL